ncbi:MAG: long-chain-fatty-acid--CoA ligase, partial [Corynebacterium striatum]|nr:long-chain-fatty-acid--CoA ligase [Corynebacterium striatum]
MSAIDNKEWLQFYPEWTPHHLDYGDTTLLDIYDNNLAINPDKPATYFFGKTQTFAELDRQVRRAAAGLRAFGVRPGDKVAIVAPNCPQYVAAFYAILKLGAIAVLHNPLYTAHELEGLFKDHGARIAIAWDKTASTLEKLRGTTNLETVISINMIDAMPTTQKLALKYLPFLKSKREQLSAHAKNTVTWDSLIGNAIGGDGRDVTTPEDVTKDTVAVIMYTSGTTGQPKGAQLSHGNFFAVILQGKHWVPGLGEKPERMLCALPFFHAYGLVMNVILQPLIGGELVIIPKPDISLIMDLMKKHTPTWIPGVPTLYERIVKAAEEDNIDIKGVRAAFSGASTLPVDTVEKWEEYTGGLLVEGYGLTECSPIIVGNPMSTDRRPGYVGIPFPDTEIRIANPDNLDETQPDGVEGEVLARGHQVFKGYLNNPEATEAAFHDGWFRTGDMGIMEEDGFIRLVSRIKEIIITGGFNVYPGEVEEVLRTHPAIDDVAVVGRPRSDGSEDVVACIDLADGVALDPEGLKEFCRERL